MARREPVRAAGGAVPTALQQTQGDPAVAISWMGFRARMEETVTLVYGPSRVLFAPAGPCPKGLPGLADVVRGTDPYVPINGWYDLGITPDRVAVEQEPPRIPWWRRVVSRVRESFCFWFQSGRPLSDIDGPWTASYEAALTDEQVRGLLGEMETPFRDLEVDAAWNGIVDWLFETIKEDVLYTPPRTRIDHKDFVAIWNGEEWDVYRPCDVTPDDPWFCYGHTHVSMFEGGYKTLTEAAWALIADSEAADCGCGAVPGCA